MLVLTRKFDESIIIGGVIEVKVLKIGNGFVKLGIEAPGEIVIDRKEVAEQKAKEANDAADI